MYRFGNKEALTVNVARVFLGGFLFGNLSAVLYSLSGALVSFLVMLAIKRLPCFSITGVSVAGGTAHNCAQLVVAMLVVQTYQTIYYLPFLLVSGCITGLCLGLTAGQVMKRLPAWRSDL